MELEQFYGLIGVMALVACVVFVVLFYIKAGYGLFYSKQWGIAIPNKIAWICMEAPVFVMMLTLWIGSDRRFDPVPLLFFLLFELHYFQRSFIFPFLMKGKSKMPVSIMLMGIVFNLINGYIQGEWIFYLAPADLYTPSWLSTPMFWGGLFLFMLGMAVNMHSDHVIRHLRKPGDTRHYLPQKGMYRYVTSANYLGECVEWIGFAVLTWSLSGALFAFWTFANLAPRADAIHRSYRSEFGDQVGNKKRLIPFLW